MKGILATIFFIVLLLINSANAQGVRLIVNEAKERVDVEIGGKFFTAYRWEERFKRPVLYPVLNAAGAFVTRGFPFETRNGESVDHPHQIGCSFSYGDVNGFDFWNTSNFRTPKELERMGRIVHRKIVSVKSGKTTGELVTESDWILPDGKVILSETTKYIFRADGKTRSVDRETILTAKLEKVVFGDNKEGMFAFRLARELEGKDQTNVKITDEKGVISESSTNANLTGEFLSSTGLKDDKIWGSAAKWASVSGKIGGADVTIAVFDSSKNPNFPSSMMIRSYGLLALNSFGGKSFDPKAEERKFVLEPQKSVKFRHRLVVFGEKAAPEFIEKEYQKWTEN